MGNGRSWGWVLPWAMKYFEAVVAQPRGGTLCHWTVYFQMLDGTLCELEEQQGP